MPITTIFLDRDGTIIEDRHYLADPDGVTLLPHAAEALARFAAEGMRIFIVTNQSGIGRGYYSLEEYLACEARLNAMLQEHGVTVAATAHCPHAPDARCMCRKPRIGLWEQLCDAHGLKADECIMIGDKMADINFGRNAGFAASILVLTGKGEKTASDYGFSKGIQLPACSTPHFVADDLADAADWIFSIIQAAKGSVLKDAQ